MKTNSIKKILLVILIFISTTLFLNANILSLPSTIEYKLDIRIDYTANNLSAYCELLIENNTEQALKKVPILLYRLLSVNSVLDKNNKALTFSQNVVSISGWEKLQVNYIEILLNDSLPIGGRQIIKIDYEGYLLGYTESGWRYVKDNINKDFTIIRTDGFGYPVIGYPNDNDMLIIVKESYDYLLKVTVPNDVMVVNGGKLTNKISNSNETTFIYESLIPSWRIDIAISDYKILEKDKNKVYYFNSDSLGAKKILDKLECALDMYSDWFGAVNNYQGYSIIEVPEGYGSQKDIISFLITADNFNNKNEMLVLYHEIAHVWNVSSLDHQPCRFESEGFAQFLQFLLSERIDNQKNAVSLAAQNYIERIRSRYIEKPEYQNIPLKDYGVYDMTDYSYTLGMVVFAIFYELVGEEGFNRIIKSFYLTYNEDGATLDQFVDYCIKESPINIEVFFNDWIYSTNAVKLIMEGKTFSELLIHYKGY